MSDTGVIGSKSYAGRWVGDVKEGRKRNLHIFMKDHGANENDQSYLGYFSDLNKPVVACNFAISIGGDVVTIQTLKPGSKDVQHKNIPLAQFMDMLDLFIS
jgi:hypothetical protein